MNYTDKFAWIGGALISSQRVEFLTHGIVSHFIDISSDKQFKYLTPRIFLDDTEENRKFRKQTLGQVFGILKQKKGVVINRKLDFYLKQRNLLVHELWRKFFQIN